MDKRNFKKLIYSELTKVSKALANPYRLEIICLLAQKEFSVEELANEIEISAANASQHLQSLKASKLVTSTRHGHYIKYKLANNKVYKLWLSMSELSMEMNAEVQKVLNDFRVHRDTLQAVTMAELRERDNFDDHIFIDVRPKEEFEAGALSNAISIPIKELKERMDELDKSKKIVAYCRGAFCVFADEAIQLLREHGYEAERLEKDYTDWELSQK